MRWARLALAFIIMATLSSIASAECGWVQWLKTSALPTGETSAWGAVEAFENREQCLRDRERAIRASAARKLTRDVEVLESHLDKGLLVYSEGRQKWAMQIACFPDTINPREKK